MKTKLIACAALLMAACCGSPSARKAAVTKTEVKHGPEIVLAAPDTVGGTSVNEALANRRSWREYAAAPLTLEELSEASQIVQAEAMKYFVESFRMHKWAKTGLVWWNVIDCWPQFSDAVVDYYYTKKLAFPYIRNVQQPVLLLLREQRSLLREPPRQHLLPELHRSYQQ